MPKLSDLVEAERANLESLECPSFEHTAFVPPRPLKDSVVALISSAGLMSRRDDNVRGNSADYRSFHSSVTDRDLLINHVSVNFDRTGFAEDANTVFPRQPLKKLEEEGRIGTVAKEHYSFMGATAPEKMRENVDRLIGQLHEQKVNTVCLLPV